MPCHKLCSNQNNKKSMPCYKLFVYFLLDDSLRDFVKANDKFRGLETSTKVIHKVKIHIIS